MALTAYRLVHRGRALAAALSAAAALGVVAPAAAQEYRLTILHTANVESRLEPVKADGAACSVEERATDQCLGGVARLGGQVNVERAAARNLILLDAGNHFTGSPFWDKHKQSAAAQVMNHLRFDAMALGHKEFAEGSEVLGAFVREARFPVMGANVEVGRDPYLKDQVLPISVTERGGQRVALIGFGDEETRSRAKPSNFMRFDRIESAIPFWMKQISHMGVNKIVALSAAGVDRDKEIVSRIPNIDVIVGQAAMGRDPGAYPLVTKGANGKTALIALADPYGKSMGKLEVVFDRGGDVKSWTGSRVALDRKAPEDPEVNAIVERLR